MVWPEADRGKIIMACGTGKTFTALQIAEAIGWPGRARPVPCAVALAHVAVDPGMVD